MPKDRGKITNFVKGREKKMRDLVEGPREKREFHQRIVKKREFQQKVAIKNNFLKNRIKKHELCPQITYKMQISIMNREKNGNSVPKFRKNVNFVKKKTRILFINLIKKRKSQNNANYNDKTRKKG